MSETTVSGRLKAHALTIPCWTVFDKRSPKITVSKPRLKLKVWFTKETCTNDCSSYYENEVILGKLELLNSEYFSLLLKCLHGLSAIFSE